MITPIKDSFFMYAGITSDIVEPIKEKGQWKSGTYKSIAKQYAHAQVIVMSHMTFVNPDLLPNETIYYDTEYDQMAELMSEIKALNPNTKIFGYVSGTADMPLEVIDPEVPWKPTQPWNCPNGVCSNFVWLVNQHRRFPELDGIMIDLVADAYISAATRNNIINYCHNVGLNVMCNCPQNAANAQFALDSGLLGEGDYILIEGFIRAKGQDKKQDGTEAIQLISQYYASGVRVACITSEPWSTLPGKTVNTESENWKKAREIFYNHYIEGNVIQYSDAGLGIGTGVANIQDPKEDL